VQAQINRKQPAINRPARGSPTKSPTTGGDMSLKSMSVALFLALALVPVAGARVEYLRSAVVPSATTCHQYCDVAHQNGTALSTPVVVRTEAAPSRGFEWVDAGIGFGVACGVVLIGAGALAIRRRSRLVQVKTAG
jgi:hypothetical protein